LPLANAARTHRPLGQAGVSAREIQVRRSRLGALGLVGSSAFLCRPSPEILSVVLRWIVCERTRIGALE
jgi:hypothetical protein